MVIPAWPASRPLNIGDKPLFDGLFEQLQPRVSELTFAGLYLFRTAHEYQFSRIGDSIVLQGRGYDGGRYCLPPLGGNISRACDLLLGGGLDIYGVEEGFAAQHLTNREHEAVEERDSFDYLYLREELATLPGNRFHKKKNRISYFTSRHAHAVHLFSAQHLCGCLQLLDEWLDQHRFPRSGWGG